MTPETHQLILVAIGVLFVLFLIVMFHGRYNLIIKVSPTGGIYVSLTRHGEPIGPLPDDPIIELPEIFQNAFARVSAPVRRVREQQAANDAFEQRLIEAVNEGDVLTFHHHHNRAPKASRSE